SKTAALAPNPSLVEPRVWWGRISRIDPDYDDFRKGDNSMSLNIFWFLPTHGDGKYLGTSEGAPAVDHGYLAQIAQAADRLGFGGVLRPAGRSCEDSWLVAASLIPVTQTLKFLVALRPGIISPTVAARQAATLDRLSGGRALFNLVTGGDP